MNWRPAFAVVLLAVTLVTYFGGYILNNQLTVKRKRCICWSLSILGLLPLLVFKYYNFLNSSITEGLEQVGFHFYLPGLNWAIPVGISFFTFQAIGYLLDVYHQRIPAEKNLLNYILFVSFFPQVTSGPISKGSELLPQIRQPHCFKYEQGRDGLKLLLWGMFMKLVIADRLGIFVDTVYANYANYNGTTCFIASIFYTIQIYCDFSGYSLMAIGIAKTLGFNLVNNFNRPYFATSITEFWKRWHISLTRWLTTHVYINLGGNRCSKFRQYCNIMVTFLVSGLWHGANWTFVVWGALHGLFQIIEKFLGLNPKGKYAAAMDNRKFLTPIRMLITFLLVNFAWVFFRMPSINDSFYIIGHMFSDIGIPKLSDMSGAIWIMLFSGLFILGFKDVKDEFFKGRLLFFDKKIVRWIEYIIIFCLIIAFGVLDGGQFIYVSF